ncbi:ABC transporter substrate-binding protein [Pseudoroseomonas wenyumeiae]
MLFALPAAALLAGSLPVAPARAQGQSQSLTLAVAAPPTSLDPHYHTLSPNNMVAEHFFDKLVDRDNASKIQPGLAESWKLLDDTTWEFKLRKGVKFSNGDEFNAEDVVATLKRIPSVTNSPGPFTIYSRAVIGHEIVDPHTIRLKTAEIYPLLPQDLSWIYVIHRSMVNAATGTSTTARR